MMIQKVPIFYYKTESGAGRVCGPPGHPETSPGTSSVVINHRRSLRKPGDNLGHLSNTSSTSRRPTGCYRMAKWPLPIQEQNLRKCRKSFKITKK